MSYFINVFILFSFVFMNVYSSDYKQTYTKEEIKKRRDIIKMARNFLKNQSIDSSKKGFRRDCSGFLQALMYSIDLPLKGYVYAGTGSVAKNMYLNFKNSFWNKKDRLPIPGDFIYFDNTYDRNKNKRMDDSITHVGLVETVDDDQTISMIHLMNGKVRRDYINLKYPNKHMLNKKTINSYLRRRPKGDKRKYRYLASHMYKGFTKSVPVIIKRKKEFDQR